MNKYKRTIEITEEELNAVEDIFFCQVSDEKHIRIWPLLAHVWEQLCPEDIKTLKKQRAVAQFIGSGPQGIYQALMEEREQERQLERQREKTLGVSNENNKTEEVSKERQKVIKCSAKVFAPISKTPAPLGSPYAFIIAYDAKCPYCGFVMHETLDPSISIYGGLQLNPVNRCEHFAAAVIESENDAQGNPKLLKVMVGFNEQKITDEEIREEQELADMGLGDYLQGIERDDG